MSHTSVNTTLSSARVLVIGAGGIGCELLKNLVLTGFENIDVIDLDTIELSNLNRQLLFQRQHVGLSKAEVAKQAVLELNPNAKITSMHNSIMSPEYDVSFFKHHDLVMNALDNKAARVHVNRMCLAAEIPLIESGSAGYLGQVTVIRKAHTECYECSPKPAQKTFPGCTIRNTPSEPIHCIVWAKHLFNQLFGVSDADEDVSPDVADPELQEGEKTEADQAHSNGVENGSLQRVSTRAWAVEKGYDPRLLFEKMFHDDVAYLLSMENLWKKRIAPKVLEWNRLSNEGASASMSSQTVWSESKCRDIFEMCVTRLKQRIADLPEDSSAIAWDKDDDVCMQFVTSCANLRAYVFGIEPKSLFDVKSMAGNIIPAIATTNAMVAACIVIEALKILAGRFAECRSVFLNRKPNFRGRILNSIPIDRPNPKCYVCSAAPEVHVRLNPKGFTIKQLEDKVLKQALGMIAPDVEVGGTILISSEEGETADLAEKTLGDLRVADGARLVCDDFLQRLTLCVLVCEDANCANGEFEILTDVSKIRSMQSETEGAGVSTGKDEDDFEPICVESSDERKTGAKRSADEESGVQGKKQRTR